MLLLLLRNKNSYMNLIIRRNVSKIIYIDINKEYTKVNSQLNLHVDFLGVREVVIDSSGGASDKARLRCICL